MPNYIAVVNDSPALVRIWDVDNNVEQVGSDLDPGIGSDRVAVWGALVATLHFTERLLKVFDINNSNTQLGEDISLPDLMGHK